MLAGAVLAASKLTLNVLDRILQGILQANRKISIGVENYSGNSWTSINTYFSSGKADDGVSLPYYVAGGMALLYSAKKSDPYAVTGVVGVLSYKMSDGNTVAILFSVPFDYNLYQNKWNCKVYPGRRVAASWMYREINNDAPFLGNDSWQRKTIGLGYSCSGFMNSSGEAKLQVRVYRGT